MYNTFIICFSLEINKEEESQKEERDSSAHLLGLSGIIIFFQQSSFFFIRASEHISRCLYLVHYQVYFIFYNAIML